MKSSHLYVAFLFATLFTIQAYSIRLDSPQLTLGLPADTVDHNYYNRLGLKELFQVSSESQTATQTIANVLRYYIDGREYFNHAQSLFCEANTEGRGFITLQKYYQITDAQGIHRVDARRVSEYVRGVFGALHNDTDDTPIDAFSFSQAVDLLLAESISIATFAYIVQDSRHSRHVTVSADQVETALVNVFNTYGRLLPQPNCEEIRYLFNQTDADQDRALNLQEFHIFLSIYLRFFKSGIQNNRYAVSVMKDRVFEYVWDNEDGLGGHTEKSRFLKLAFARFLQMTVYDSTQNQMSHVFFTKFDADGSGAIDKDEFTALLEFFRAPTNEVEVLFIAADTDGSGAIDFAEFVVTLTTLLRRLTADFGYNLITLDGGRTTVEEAYQAFREATNFLNIELMSQQTFTETFESVGTGALGLEDFSRFASEIIGQLRQRVRLQEEAQITELAAADVNTVTEDDIRLTLEEASEQVSDIIYSDQGFTTQEFAIGAVQRETGATEEEINDVVGAQIEGATIEDVVQAAENIATEQVIDAVTAAVLESAESGDCPTEQAIEEAIEAVLEDGTIDAIVEDLENTPSDDLIQEVATAYEEEGERQEEQAEEEEREEERTEEEAAVEEDAEALGDLAEDLGVSAEEVHEAFEVELEGASVEDVIGAVEAIATEEVIDAVAEAILENECPTEDTIQEAIEQVIEDGTVEEIIENLETPEDLIETVTETVDEQAVEQEAEDFVTEIQEESGYTADELNDAVEEQLGGATVEDVIEAAQEIATEQVIEAVTEAALEEAASSDCPTQETIEEAIEAAIENGAVADVVEELENTPAEDLLETVTETVEEGPSGEEASEEPQDVAEALEQETGYTLEEINETVEEQTGGESVEDVIAAAEDLAEQEIINIVTDAVLEEAASADCPTEQTIQETIEEVLESGAVEDIVEEIAEASPEEIVGELTEAAEEHAAEAGPTDDVQEQLEEDTGISIEELNETIEEQTGGASVEEVIEAAQEVAAEEVIDAVTEAVLEEAAEGCPTEESIQETIQEVIEDGLVEDIVEQLGEQSAEELVETLTETAEENRPEEPVWEEPQEVVGQVEEETGYTAEEIQDVLECEDESVAEAVEAAQEAATEEVIDAVTDAVLEEAASADCVTEESIQEVIEEVIDNGVVEDIVEQLETAPEELLSEEPAQEEPTAEQIVEETGYTIEEINEAIEEQTGGASVEEIVAAAEELATEQVIEAVADAVVEQDCVTAETLEAVVEEVIEGGIVDELIEQIEEVAPEELVEAAAEAAEEERHVESAFIQLSGFKNFLG